MIIFVLSMLSIDLELAQCLIHFCVFICDMKGLFCVSPLGAPYKKILPRRNRHVDHRPDPLLPASMGLHRGRDSDCPLQLHLAAPREAQEQPGLLPRGEPLSSPPSPQAAAIWGQHALPQAPAPHCVRRGALRGWTSVLQPRRGD